MNSFKICGTSFRECEKPPKFIVSWNEGGMEKELQTDNILAAKMQVLNNVESTICRWFKEKYGTYSVTGKEDNNNGNR